MDLKEKRIVFIGMDDILIHTISKMEKPLGIWDLKFKVSVLEQLKQLNPLAIFVVSNNPEIPEKLHPALFQAKFMYVIASIQDFVGFQCFTAGQFAPEEVKGSTPLLLPSKTMLEAMYNEFRAQSRMDIKPEECVVIGNGLQYQEAAKSFGCEYLGLEDFISEVLPEPLFKVVDFQTGEEYISPETGLILKDIPFQFAAYQARLINKGKEENPLVMVVPKCWKKPAPLPHKKFKVDASKMSAKQVEKVAMKIKKGGKRNANN